MRPEASARTKQWRNLALALAQGCSAASADQLASNDDAAAASNGQDAVEQEDATGCGSDVDELLAEAGVETAPRVDCGAFRASAASAGGHGAVACFLQQASEKQAAVELRFTTGGIDSGPITYFVADGAGGLWSVMINPGGLASDESRSASVESCASLDLAGSGVAYCTSARSLYRCSASR